MATYTIPIPPAWRDNVSDDTPGAITEELEGQGMTVDAVSVRANDATGLPIALVIEANGDPTPHLAAFATAVSQERQRLRTDAARCRSFVAAIEAGQPVTAAQTQQVLAALIRVVEWHVRDQGL